MISRKQPCGACLPVLAHAAASGHPDERRALAYTTELWPGLVAFLDEAAIAVDDNITTDTLLSLPPPFRHEHPHEKPMHEKPP